MPPARRHATLPPCPDRARARISAVEGVALTDEMRATLERFDREGLSAEERRRAILALLPAPR